MRRKDMRQGMTVVLAMITGLFLLSPGLTFAGVQGGAGPTVAIHSVKVGQTGLNWTFDITNTSKGDNALHPIRVTNILLTTACGVGSPDPNGHCPDPEAINTIEVSPTTGRKGVSGTACANVTFTFSATANPNEYQLIPDKDVILEPTSPPGQNITCTIPLQVNINKGVKDTTPPRTTFPIGFAELHDDTAVLDGFGSGTDFLEVSRCQPTIVTTPDPLASTIPPTPAVLNDKARLIPDPTCPNVALTGNIQFQLFGPGDQTCSKAAICTKNVTPVSPCISPSSCEPSTGCNVTQGGVYNWIATYSGDISNDPAFSNCADESVPVLSITTTQNPTSACPGAVINDSATLSGGKEPVGGAITFRLFGPGDNTCSTAICTKTKNVSGNGTYDTISLGGCTANAGPGTYHWTACYSGDTNNNHLPVPLCSPCTGSGSEPVDIKDIPVTISTQAEPQSGCVDAVLNDSATLKGGCEPPKIGGTIIFKLFGPNDDHCSNPPIFTSDPVTVNGTGTYNTPDGFTATEKGTYHWIACYNTTNCSPCTDAKETVVINDNCQTTGESPYIGIVGNDIEFNPFYFSEKHRQFLFDQEAIGVHVCFGTNPPASSQTRVPPSGEPQAGCEQFRSNKPINQAEICDTKGVVHNIFKGDFEFLGEPNAVITKQNAGYFEWWIRLPKTPDGEINICIQCGVLKPNTFLPNGFGAVNICAAETGERIGRGFCTRNQVDAGVNPIINTALPKITAIAYPGPFSIGFTPFHLTAYKNPGIYNLTGADAEDLAPDGAPAPVEPLTPVMKNSASLQVLNGSTNARVLLKSCMDKCVIAKIPVTDQLNALGETEADLAKGDLIKVRLDVPINNTVDIYCHSQSTKIMGIGVPD